MSTAGEADRPTAGKHEKLVFTSVRDVLSPSVALPPGLTMNARQQMDGLAMMQALPDIYS